MSVKKELIADRDPKSPISEVFRTLRTNIQFMDTNKKMKTLLITSSYPGEGKSWVASNLAVTFAQTGKKVLLIDADLRKGRQHLIFGALPKPGLSNCLVDIDIDDFENFDVSKYIQKTDVKNLLLMPAGDVPPNPSELLLSKQMSKLLDGLKEVCNLIIIDGTPCDLVTDSVILSRIVDSTLVVAAHKETKKEGLDRTIKRIQNVGGKIAGVVINKMPISINKYNEKYYYHQNTNKKESEFLRHNMAELDNNNKDNDIDSEYNNIYNNKYNNQNDFNSDSSSNENKYEKDLNQNSYNNNSQGYYSNNETNNTSVNNNIDDFDEGKTQDILNQINSYLDKEKKDLK